MLSASLRAPGVTKDSWFLWRKRTFISGSAIIIRVSRKVGSISQTQKGKLLVLTIEALNKLVIQVFIV